MGSPPSLPRQIPEKVTTAPISVRPLVSAAISRAMSKSASWMRIVTIAVIRSSQSFGNGLTAGHRREEGNLAGAGDHGIRLDMGVVDRGADHLRLFESIGIGFAALRKPGDEIIDRAHLGRRLDRFFRLADPFAHPGEIFELHPSSSSMR